MMPAQWAREHLNESSREHWLNTHDLAPLPDEVSGFLEWFERRSVTLSTKLTGLLVSASTR